MNVINECTITNNIISLDGKELFAAPHLTSNEFLTEAYRSLKINYPKFFKMDFLSKTAFIGMEMLIQKVEDIIDKKIIPVILYNSSSSIEVDQQFQQSMEGIPSPSLFVYTLPNVMIGEICIRHKLYGENYLFIMKEPDIESVFLQTNILLQGKEYDKCITGYVNYAEGKMTLFLFLVTKFNI